MRSLALLLFASAAQAQTTYQVPLAYNFNGIVHTGEAALPDDLMGYRSISDRALDFQMGVPTTGSLGAYSLVANAGALDIVHLGNRNTVAGALWAFDPAPDGDDIGIQPTWLANVDQSGPQTTALAAPILLETTSSASFLFQISNGGGTFDVTFDFASALSLTAQLSGGDWFGGVLAATELVDQAASGGSLSVTESSVDLSARAGETLTAITFSNRSNTNAGYAILACNVETAPGALVVNQVSLAYNFNGIVHAGEAGLPDDPLGFRSISDRALDFQQGVPSDALLDPYSLVDQPGVLDIVHLGDRNAVNASMWAFDPAPDGDEIGIQPTWLTSTIQNGPQRTTLATPIALQPSSEATFLYQISNGGGAFDVRFDLASGASFTATLTGSDWFGGAYTGTGGVDLAAPSDNLSITQGRVDLSAFAGDRLVAISFENPTNINAGYAILACNVLGTALGTEYCAPAVANSTGAPASITADGSDVAAANDVVLRASGLPSNSFGFFLTSRDQGSVPGAGGSAGTLCLGGSIGRYVGPGQVLNSGTVGAFELVLDLTQHPTPTGLVTVQAGETWSFQAWYRDAVGGMPVSNFTSGRSIAFQ